jgi:hypothetical protein
MEEKSGRYFMTCRMRLLAVVYSLRTSDRWLLSSGEKGVDSWRGRSVEFELFCRGESGDKLYFEEPEGEKD